MGVHTVRLRYDCNFLSQQMDFIGYQCKCSHDAIAPCEQDFHQKNTLCVLIDLFGGEIYVWEKINRSRRINPDSFLDEKQEQLWMCGSCEKRFSCDINVMKRIWLYNLTPRGTITVHAGIPFSEHPAINPAPQLRCRIFIELYQFYGMLQNLSKNSIKIL